jgi:hypothetical protein
MGVPSHRNGISTTLDDPLPTYGTAATGINTAGDIVGCAVVFGLAAPENLLTRRRNQAVLPLLRFVKATLPSPVH